MNNCINNQESEDVSESITLALTTCQQSNDIKSCMQCISIIELVSESNNKYEFYIELNNYSETIFIYAPNYNIALNRAKQYIKSQES